MKKLIYLLLLMLCGNHSFAQIEKPVKWEFAVQKTSATEATIYLKATIRDRWHIYSLDKESEGPVKTSFRFSPSADYTLDGKISQPVPQSRFEKAFNSKVTFFEKEVIFSQKIHIRKNKGSVHGTVEYMTCSDQKCLPPETLPFIISLD